MVSEKSFHDWRQVVEENYTALLALCRRMCRDSDRAYAAMSEVVCEKMQPVLDTYDETYDVPLMAHVVLNLKWYIYKWLKKNDQHRERYGSLDQALAGGMTAEPQFSDDLGLDDRELAARVLAELDEYDRAIILLRVVDDLTITDLAEQFGISRGSAHGHLVVAMERAKAIAKRLVQ